MPAVRAGPRVRMSCLAQPPGPRASLALRLGLSAAVAGASLAPRPAAAAPEVPRAAEEHYDRGVRERDAGNFAVAAQEFTAAYAQIPPERKDLRASVLFDLVDAHRGAYNAGGRVRGKEHPAAHLCDADEALAEFVTAEAERRGKKKSPDAVKAAELRADIKSQLDKARAQTPDLDCATVEYPRDTAAADPVPPPTPEADAKPSPPRRSGPIDRPLVIAGGVLTGVGLIMVGVMAGGLVRGKRAEADGDALVASRPTLPRDDAQLAEIDDRGKSGNRMAIAGGVVGALALGTGVALLVLGLRGKPTRVAVAPYMAHRAGGLSLRWQF